MTMCAQCMAIVADGPATTGEIAAELCAAPRKVSATMMHLLKRGLVARSRYRKPRSDKAGRRATSMWHERSND